MMGEAVQFLHESADTVFIEIWKISGPVVLIPQSPEDHRRVVVMLADHVGQHPPRLSLVLPAAESATTPGDLFPYQDAQAIAEMQDDPGLLVVGEPDIVHAHGLHEDHLLPHLILGHG